MTWEGWGMRQAFVKILCKSAEFCRLRAHVGLVISNKLLRLGQHSQTRMHTSQIFMPDLRRETCKQEITEASTYFSRITRLSVCVVLCWMQNMTASNKRLGSSSTQKKECPSFSLLFLFFLNRSLIISLLWDIFLHIHPSHSHVCCVSH